MKKTVTQLFVENMEKEIALQEMLKALGHKPKPSSG